jgi:aminopeptidase N
VLASWINSWYPRIYKEEEEHFWKSLKSPGTIQITIPVEWRVASSGERISREEFGQYVIEEWTNDGSVAFSFSTGPYITETYKLEDSELTFYGFSNHIQNQERRAQAFMTSLKIFTQFFGDAPYPYHSIVEVPYYVQGFYGASEQNYILLKTQAFDDQLNSLAVLAHEAAHAWWGTSVSSTEKESGGLWMTESIAQYSAVMAIEKVHGLEAAIDFMKTGKGSFSPNHNADAYKRIVRNGQDQALSEITFGSKITHYIADSKGTWVYHMLRRKMGDEAFIQSLRSIMSNYADMSISRETWIDSFKMVGKEKGINLTSFFNQWLNRTGAPELEAMFDSNTIIINQNQEDVYELDLLVRIEYEDNTSEELNVLLESEKKKIESKSSSKITRVIIDPNNDLLLLSNQTKQSASKL